MKLLSRCSPHSLYQLALQDKRSSECPWDHEPLHRWKITDSIKELTVAIFLFQRAPKMDPTKSPKKVLKLEFLGKLMGLGGVHLADHWNRKIANLLSYFLELILQLCAFEFIGAAFLNILCPGPSLQSGPVLASKWFHTFKINCFSCVQLKVDSSVLHYDILQYSKTWLTLTIKITIFQNLANQVLVSQLI